MAARAKERLDSLADGKTYSGAEGILVAEGDSWFDYPGTDIINILRWRYNYRVECVAHHGDTLENMAYNDKQFTAVVSALRRVRDEKQRPRAILLSAGGNDIAGPELAVMLNHRRSGLPTIDPAIANEILAVRLRTYLISIITAISQTNKAYFGTETIPILIHGYDYPVPDGRGYLSGWWRLPGPWLEPAFHQKGHWDQAQNTTAMQELIERYNAMLKTIPAINGYEHVRYVDLRGTLRNQPGTYKHDWDNELHPTEPGFQQVAERFATAIASTPKP